MSDMSVRHTCNICKRTFAFHRTLRSHTSRVDITRNESAVRRQREENSDRNSSRSVVGSATNNTVQKAPLFPTVPEVFLQKIETPINPNSFQDNACQSDQQSHDASCADPHEIPDDISDVEIPMENEVTAHSTDEANSFSLVKDLSEFYEGCEDEEEEMYSDLQNLDPPLEMLKGTALIAVRKCLSSISTIAEAERDYVLVRMCDIESSVEMV